MAELRDFPRRVLVEDTRRNGGHLRVTWHREADAPHPERVADAGAYRASVGMA